MNRFVRVPSLIVWLTALWLLLWADFTLGNVVGGVLVALVVVGVARPTGVTGLERTYFRPFSALIYAGYFLWQLLTASLIVAWEIITPGSRLNRAIIAVPMHTASVGIVTLVANTVTLTPGTVTLEVAEEAGPTPDDPVRLTLYIHVLHFRSVDLVRRDVMRLERLAIRAFGSRRDLPALDADLTATKIASDTGHGDAR